MKKNNNIKNKKSMAELISRIFILFVAISVFISAIFSTLTFFNVASADGNEFTFQYTLQQETYYYRDNDWTGYYIDSEFTYCFPADNNSYYEGELYHTNNTMYYWTLSAGIFTIQDTQLENTYYQGYANFVEFDTSYIVFNFNNLTDIFYQDTPTFIIYNFTDELYRIFIEEYDPSSEGSYPIPSSLNLYTIFNGSRVEYAWYDRTRGLAAQLDFSYTYYMHLDYDSAAITFEELYNHIPARIKEITNYHDGGGYAQRYDDHIRIYPVFQGAIDFLAIRLANYPSSYDYNEYKPYIQIIKSQGIWNKLNVSQMGTLSFATQNVYNNFEGNYAISNVSAIEFLTYIADLPGVEPDIVYPLKDVLTIFAITYGTGYGAGFEAGKEVTTQELFFDRNRVYEEGRAQGRIEGAANANDYTFMSLLGAVIDAPITAFKGLLNFEILGINMLPFILGFMTLGIVILVVKIILGGK